MPRAMLSTACSFCQISFWCGAVSRIEWSSFFCAVLGRWAMSKQRIANHWPSPFDTSPTQRKLPQTHLLFATMQSKSPANSQLLLPIQWFQPSHPVVRFQAKLGAAFQFEPEEEARLARRRTDRRWSGERRWSGGLNEEHAFP